MNAFKVLHVDDVWLVVDKPAGLLAVPGLGAGRGDNLTTFVQSAYADARVVHRLDQATSGLMVFARGAAAQRTLSMAFEARLVRKSYVAVVHGAMAGEEGEIEAPLMPDWPNRPRQIVDTQRGKPALTRWRVIERGTETTRVLLQPLTGRTHQLRVHLQSIGHPIVGDALYASELPHEPRLLLHATQLALAHPLTAMHCAFVSAPPF